MSPIIRIFIILVSTWSTQGLEFNYSSHSTANSSNFPAVTSEVIARCAGSNLTEGVTISSYLSTISKATYFRFVEYQVNCALGHMKVIQIPLKSKSNNSDEFARFQFSPSGIIESYKVDGDLDRSIRDFCISNISQDSMEIWVCSANCDQPTHACIPKCCPTGQIFSDSLAKCVGDEGMPWKPRLHNDDETLSPVQPFASFERIYMPMLDFCTTAHDSVLQITDHRFFADGTEIRLLKTGKLMMLPNTAKHKANRIGNLSQQGWEQYDIPFCIERDLDSNEIILLDLDCPDVAIYDYSEQGRIMNFKMILNLVHGSLMVISAFFLLISAGIYVALWDKQNTHGWTVFSYIVSLLLAYICLAISKLHSATRLYVPKSTSSLCIINGIMAHFFFVSVFTWLTVINFDIWWKFWNLKAKPIKAKEPRKFAIYALFAFGIPTIIVAVGLTIGVATTYEKNPALIPPGYGKLGNCFLQAKAQGVYLYYPIGFLIGVNLIFFGFTIRKIIQHFRSTTHLHSDKEEQEFESAKVVVKLFVVMGVTWIFEFLSFMFLPYQQNMIGMTIWGIFDCFNLLQSLGIFYIFIWKRLILNQLSTKFPWLAPLLKSLKGAPGCRKKIDYRSSSRLTTKLTTKTSISVAPANQDSIKHQSIQIRKLSSSSDIIDTDIIKFETIELT